MADTSVNTTSLSNLFKIKYGPSSYAVFNTSTPLWSRVKKTHGAFKGKGSGSGLSGYTINAVLGFTGSVGALTLPQTNVYQDVNAVLARKKQYARMLLDREAMLSSDGKDAAFEQVTKYQTKKCVESFMRNLERQLFAYENGKIFEGDNATNVTGAGTTGSPYVVRGLSTSWVDGFVEIGDSVQMSGETTVLNISSVNRTTRDVSLVGVSAALAAAAAGPTATAAKAFIQGLNAVATNGDLQSILGAVKATTGTLYGVTVGERFKSQQVDASSAGITTDIINQVVTQVEQFAGESPNMIVTSFKQYRKLQDVLGDKLRYMDVTNRDKVFRKTEFNFQGIQWNTTSGLIPVVTSKMCPDDHLFALNTDMIELFTAQAPKWFDEDGTVLLRSSVDAYEARYGFYGELFVHPQGQGVVFGLA